MDLKDTKTLVKKLQAELIEANQAKMVMNL
jgi:hypothetical protein